MLGESFVRYTLFVWVTFLVAVLMCSKVGEGAQQANDHDSEAIGRASGQSSRWAVAWCLASVDQCWSQKERFYDADEMDDAVEAYEHARRVYRRILGESVAD